jgi:hypothetical protein
MAQSLVQETEDDTKVLVSRLRSRRGRVSEVNVVDLSLAGCLIERQALVLYLEDRILLKLPGLRYLPVHVAWIEDRHAGLVFEEPLYEPVLNHVVKSFIARDRRYDLARVA